ncbi:MAG: HlyC/CorC family transporter [Pseudomonadota bacterium]
MDHDIGLLLALLVVLLVLSGFFSASETGLMTLNRYRLRHLAERGHPRAREVEALLKRTDRLIGLILLGNTFFNIAASSLATLIALRLWGEGSIAITTGVLTVVTLIVSEVAPKTLAVLYPERVAFASARVYRFLLPLLYPLVWVVNQVVNRLLGALGVLVTGHSQNTLNQEELRTVVREAGAMIPKRHQEMLLAILDMEKSVVDDIMVPRNEIQAIDLQNPLPEILSQLRHSPYTRLLVYDGSLDTIVGVLHARTAMHRLLEDGDITIEALRTLCRPAYFIPAGTPLHVQLLNFQRERRRMGLVVDEYGDLVGLVTLFDLLEEIVGEITTDPWDQIPDVLVQEDGSLIIDGSTAVRELNRQLNWHLPTNGPKTLNGLILEYLETIPEPGTSLRLHGHLVEILQTNNNAVRMVKVPPNPLPNEVSTTFGLF